MNPRRWLEASNLLIAAGAVLLVLPAAHLTTGWNAQSRGLAEIAAPRAVLRAAPLPREGETLGRLELPRIGLDLVVFEGTSDATLRKGPGHLPGTAWPAGAGDTGNCVIAGHRDSFFRRLAKAREGDLVRLSGPSGTTTYLLEKRRIVRPQETDALAPNSAARLTLVTCYPFRWVGDAPYRLVWTALPDSPASPAGEARLSAR